MAELTDSDVRQISTVFGMMGEIRNAVTEIRNMVREIRTTTAELRQSQQTHVSLQSAIGDMRTTINNIRNDTVRFNDLLTATTSAVNSLSVLQQSLLRIESFTSNTMQSAHGVNHIQNDLNNMHQVLANMEQFMSDLSVYIQNLQLQLTSQQANSEQIQPQV